MAGNQPAPRPPPLLLLERLRERVIAMEFVAGETLAQRFARGPLEVPVVIAYARQMRSAALRGSSRSDVLRKLHFDAPTAIATLRPGVPPGVPLDSGSVTPRP